MADITLALVLKSETNWPWQFVLAVKHNVSAQTINCLCSGLHAKEMDSLIEYLRACASLASNELLVPVSLLSLTCQELSQAVDKMQEDLWHIQRDTGLHGACINHDPRDLSVLNLNNIIRQLTALSDHCTRSISRTETLKRLLIPLEAILQRQERRNSDGCRIIRDHLQLIEQTISGSQHYVNWYLSSANGQVQTVYKPLTC